MHPHRQSAGRIQALSSMLEKQAQGLSQKLSAEPGFPERLEISMGVGHSAVATASAAVGSFLLGSQKSTGKAGARSQEANEEHGQVQHPAGSGDSSQKQSKYVLGVRDGHSCITSPSRASPEVAASQCQPTLFWRRVNLPSSNTHGWVLLGQQPLPCSHLGALGQCGNPTDC